jgi:hypothetical protein
MTKKQTQWLTWAITAALIIIGTLIGVQLPRPPGTPGLFGSQGVSGGVSDFTGIRVSVPTAQTTATPAVLIDSNSPANLFEIRDAGTPVWTVNDGGAIVSAFASGESGSSTFNNWIKVAAPTAIATATPAAVIDSLGVSNILEVRDGTTAVFTINDGGAVLYGADGTAYDVTFYSDTAGDTMLWDQSEEALTITGTNAQDALNVDDGNVDIADDVDVDGTTNLDDVDIDLSAEFEVDGHMTDFGGCTASVADGDGDVCVSAVLEVDGELEIDGTLDADSTSDFADTVTLSKASGNALVVTAGGTISLPATSDIASLGYVGIGDGTPDGAVTSGNDEELYVEGELEVDGEAEFDGIIDADSTSDFADTMTLSKGSGNALVIASGGTLDANGDVDVDGTSNLDEVDIDGVTNLIVGTEHIGTQTIWSTAITWTAAAGGSGTVATIGDGEIWIVHSVFVNVTTNFDCTGDDTTLVIGDGNDANGFIDLADAELQTTDTEGTGWAAGWQGLVVATQGVYLDEATGSNSFIYAPSGSAETIDWLLDEGSGESITAGAATIYVVYTRIQ